MKKGNECNVPQRIVLELMEYRTKLKKAGKIISKLRHKLRQAKNRPEYVKQKSSTLLKNKFLKFKETKGKCEVCGNRARHIHHIDGNRFNNDISNLTALCPKCHFNIHGGKERTSKYKRMFGETIKDIADLFNVPKSYAYHLANNEPEVLRQSLKKKKQQLQNLKP